MLISVQNLPEFWGKSIEAMSTMDVQSIINDIVATWKSTSTVIVVDSFDGLPSSLQKDIAKQDAETNNGDMYSVRVDVGEDRYGQLVYHL
jgi:hypothetical protein